jgi:putative transposase
MIQHKAYKFRLYPTQAQANYFEKCFGCSRFIYNKFLEYKINDYKNNTKLTPKSVLFFKKQYEWLKEVDSLALCNAYLNINTAYQNFFKKYAKFPKFKNKRQNQSYTTNNVNNSIEIVNNSIKLPKCKNVKAVIHREIKGKIKSATISKQANQYYVSILCEEDIQPMQSLNKEIGLDLGVKDLVITSDGDKFENPKALRRNEKKLKRLQRELARRKKGSKRRQQTKNKLQRQHKRITDVKNDYLHNVSKKIVSENQTIYIEDLNVAGMMKNHHLAKSVGEASMSKFVSMLEYKCKWYGRNLVKIDRFYPSSKLCSCCGYKNNELTLSVRQWECPQCHTKHDRDINASKNILYAGAMLVNGRGDTELSVRKTL